MRADAELIVVGDGIMGSSIARAAHRRRCEVLMIANGAMSGSRAAAGIVRLGWMHSKVQRERTLRSLELYRESGLLLADRGLRSSYRTPEQEPKLVWDWYVVDVASSFVLPNVFGTVVAADESGVTLDSGQRITAKCGVVIAAGPGSAAFGAPIIKRSYGATAVGPATPGMAPLRIHTVRPYVDLMATNHHGQARVGSSTTKHDTEAVDALRKMMLSFPSQLPEVADHIIGVRAYTALNPAEAFDIVWNGNMAIVAGFGKFGYALAPAIAEEVVGRLCPL